MKEKPVRSRTDFQKLDAMKDSDIDYSDIPELPDDFAESAEWFMLTPLHASRIENEKITDEE